MTAFKLCFQLGVNLRHYASDKLIVEVMFATASGCREEGTSGSGLLSIKLGDDDSVVQGTVEAVKRCGEYARSSGAMELNVTVEVGRCRLTPPDLGFVHLTLRLHAFNACH